MRSTIMKLFTCFILSFCIAAHSHAARTHLFSFDTALHLPQPAHFSAVKVIDARTDTTSLGKYVSGFWTEDIVTKTAFGEALSNYASQLTAGQAPSGNAHLLVVLKHLDIVPTNATRISTLYADATFFSGNNGRYKFLFHADSFFEARAAKEESGWEQQMNEVWFRYFQHAAQINSDTISDTAIYTIVTAQKYEEETRQRYPAYTTANYPTGVYLTAEEFLQLKPGLRDFKQWKNRENPDKPYTYYRVNEQGNRGDQLNDTEFYAVYDGKNWYKSGPNSLYKMNLDKAAFYFTGKMRGLRAYDPGMTNSALINLAIRISSAAELKKHPEDVNLYRIKLDPVHDRFIPVFRYYTPR